jgi:aerobic carbon-monoxide dehydrogenase medium subunit
VTGGTVDVVIPTTPEEAVHAFGDGDGITVLAGGTIVMPELTHGRLKPGKVLMLGRSGLDKITREEGTVTIGATVPVSELEELDEPLASAARHVADREIRAQATVGGNVCAPPGSDAPRGDLQAPLIALGARVRSAGRGGERIEPVEEFLAGGVKGRLVLDVSYDVTERQAAYAAAWRPHTHHYSILAVAATKTNGEVRLAATGAGPHAVRLTSAERSGEPNDALNDVDPPDDALASAWYRKTVLPTLVTRALADLA